MGTKYEVVIYWSAEDQAFIAEAPELPGCMADGGSHREALANLEVVIQEWIDTATELRRAIPEPRGRLMFAKLTAQADALTQRASLPGVVYEGIKEFSLLPNGVRSSNPGSGSRRSRNSG